MSQRIIDRSYVGEVLQRIYSSDLNTAIAITIKHGYYYLSLNENSTALSGTTIEEAVTHVAVTLAEQYPSSAFADWWTNTFEESENK